MSEQSFSTEIIIQGEPEIVFKAITMHIDQWWTVYSNSVREVGDRLTVRFEHKTIWTMTVSTYESNRRLTWDVVEANHSLQGLSKYDEWLGTRMDWLLEPLEDKTRLVFSHIGLVPALQCYEICEAGWGYFLESLKRFVETGKGHPFSPS